MKTERKTNLRQYDMTLSGEGDCQFCASPEPGPWLIVGNVVACGFHAMMAFVALENSIGSKRGHRRQAP